MNNKIMRALAVIALLVLGPGMAAASAPPASRPPEQAALRFYRWYMQSLALHHDPLNASPVQMSAYVDPGLVRDLKRRRGLHADYFIQAQEYIEDWTTDIRAVRPTVQGNVASVLIILGATAETKRILALTLARTGGDWKICTVRLA